ncbi:metallophosphoesterase [Thermaerobacter subterraneus]|uniref:Phosphohydrolase n=1 Tax=Thermaerobacter subterraneus DSM 13965 TaxID=867903 RepID=K6Q3D4_9FIRM|nr:metallophosphoesterase [Thermaerobacter subterraneus]EKP95793.1 putative phosphohydrolase [Thermaerobacter subterraneus DSM 13965]
MRAPGIPTWVSPASACPTPGLHPRTVPAQGIPGLGIHALAVPAFWAGSALPDLLRLLAVFVLAVVAWGYLVEPRWLRVRAYRLSLGADARGGRPVPLPIPRPPKRPVGSRSTRAAGPAAKGAPPSPAAREGVTASPATLRAAAARPSRLRLAHLTDLHAPVYRVSEAALLRWIEAWQPDAVVFTGDLAEGKGLPARRGVELLRRLARRWPVYLVPGNHDHLYGWSRLRRELEGTGVHLLVNQGARLEQGPVGIYLAGVDDPHTGRDDLGAALAGAPPGWPVVLLAHAPAGGIRRAAAGLGAGLVLAGHTHGGQVRLPLLGALWIPGQGWFPTYDRGWFQVGGTWWFIAAGLGTPRPWIRLLCRPELVLLELVLGEEGR